MVREIIPLDRINARIQVPGSKSITNRALICAALAKGGSVIHNASDSDDTALMVNGLNQLGVLVRKKNNTLLVEGTGGKLYAPKFSIPVGNAGTTLRFLLSLASLAYGKVVFEGDHRMAERPVDDLLGALKSLGVDAKAQGAQYTVQGGSLKGGRTQLGGAKSSQFLSSLLMVASYAVEDTTVEVEGKLSSISYVDLTLDVMERFGVHVEFFDRKWFFIKAGGRYNPIEFSVEPDASGASYFLAAAAIVGGEIMVEGIKSTSIQGDMGFVKILSEMGCQVRSDNDGVRVMSDGKLKGVDVDMNSMPDVVPTLAVTALFAEGKTCIRNVAQLRYKESNRLDALATELMKLGAKITVFEDGLEIESTPLHSAQMNTYNDHRLAMSFALIGLCLSGVKIENSDCVKKSFPTFWTQFERLYAKG